jgi:hypothetical protein
MTTCIQKSNQQKSTNPAVVASPQRAKVSFGINFKHFN